MDFLDIDYLYQKKSKTDHISNVDAFNFNFNQTHKADMDLWPAGEEEAIASSKFS